MTFRNRRLQFVVDSSVAGSAFTHSSSSRKAQMELFMQVLNKLKPVHPIVIFFQALDYFEARVDNDTVNDIFARCCRDDVNGKRYLVTIPDGVNQYCQAVLDGAEPLEKWTTLPDFNVWEGEVKGEK